MTNTGGIPAGWYHAPGDPEDTQRYWDGEQWIGEPQAVAQQPPTSASPSESDQTVQYEPPTQDPPASAGFSPPQATPGGVGADSSPPSYAAPSPQSQGAAGGSTPQGYQSFSPTGTGVGTPSEYGPRVIAYLIDVGIGIGIIVVGYILALIATAIADGLGALVLVITVIAAIAYWIWNFVVKQGTTGQTIGKEQQKIKLVKDETGQPVGGGMAFVRYLLAGVLSNFTCGVYGVLDLLWPLWDDDNKRLTDKIVNMSVVMA